MRDVKEARIFLNGQCGRGRSAKAWSAVKKVVYGMLQGLVVTDLDDMGQLSASIRRPAAGRKVLYVAAGGDGTVNLLINSVMREMAADRVIIGAVGLGANNVFHKPLGRVRRVKGVPVRLDYRNTVEQDLIRAKCSAPDGAGFEIYCAGSANAGMTAEGCHYYNTAGGFIARLRDISPQAANLAASVRLLMKGSKTGARLAVGGRDTGLVGLSNVAFMKNPYLAGGLKYDTQVAHDSGIMAINVCHGLDTVAKRAAFFGALSSGKFKGLKNTVYYMDRQALLESESGFVFEYDGEISLIKSAELSVENKAITCCT